MKKKAKNTKSVTKKRPFLHTVTYEKNLAHFKMLITEPHFIEDICTIRKELLLPEELPAVFDYAQWTREQDRRDSEILNSKKFHASLQKIHKDFLDKKISHAQSKEQSWLLHDQISCNHLNNAVNFIIDKYRLPRNFDFYIYDYITMGKVNAPMHNFDITPADDRVNNHEKRSLAINVYAKLTQEDYRELKKSLAYDSRKLVQYYPIKDIDTKLKIEEWTANHAKIDPATGEEYVMYAAEIAENLLGSKKKKHAVHNAQKEMKRLRKLRFGGL